MSRPRLLSDHDLNEHIIAGAHRREPGMEIVRVRDVGLSERPDEEILEYAEQHGFLVISHDVNTMPAAAYARVAAGDSHPGLFMARQQLPVGQVIESLLLVWAASEQEEWRDQVVFLPIR